MSITTIKRADKIKLLDQMLEDIAGDEYDEYDTAEDGLYAGAKQYSEIEELDVIDTTH
jgi:hypothetical protein